MSINKGMDKEDVVYIYNGILLSHKKGKHSTICRNMVGLSYSEVKKKKNKYGILTHIFEI